MIALLVGVTGAVALLALLVGGLLRSNAELTRALHQMGFELGPDSVGGGTGTSAQLVDAPVSLTTRPTPAQRSVTDVIDLTGTTPHGDAVKLAVAGVRHDTLVAFLSSGCQTCRGFWDTFRREVPDVPGGARLVAVTRGPEAESPGTLASLSGDRLPVVMSSEVWEHYDVPYAPYFVYVSGPASRIVGEGVAARWEDVQTLVANAVGDRVAVAPAPATGRGGLPDRDRRWRKAAADTERASVIDRELRRAGIHPGDPRLHAAQAPDGAGEVQGL